VPKSNGGGGRSSAPRRGRWSQAEQARLRELYGLKEDRVIARELNRPVASVRRMAEKLFPRTLKTGPWTASEAQELKKYLGASPPVKIARILGRSSEEVEQKIQELGRVRFDRSWTREETAEFKRIYGTRTDEDLSLIFGRSEDEIDREARRHALAKDKAFVRKLRGEAATRMPRWSSEEIEILKRDYPYRPNLEIARELERTVKSVVSKAHNLGLKKSSDRLREMGRENVSQRYREE
jgi:hypothetical protein